MNTIAWAYRAFCKQPFPLPSERQVADLEERLGIPLPPDYRQFLLEYNGGLFTEPDIIPPSANCPLDGLTSMQGIGAPDPLFEFASQADITQLDDNDPLQILLIGYTMMGNLLFLIVEPYADDWGWIAMKLCSSDKSFFLGAGVEEFFARLREPED